MGNKNQKILEEAFVEVLNITNYNSLAVKMNSMIDSGRFKHELLDQIEPVFISEKVANSPDSALNLFLFAIENLWGLVGTKTKFDLTDNKNAVISLKLISILGPRLLESEITYQKL